MSKAVGTVNSVYACLLGSSVSQRHVAHRPFRFTSNSVLSNTSSPQSTSVSLHRLQTNNKTRGNSYFGWSKRGTRGNPAEDEGRYSQWNEGKSHDSAKDNEGEAIEGRDKSRDCDGTEDVEGVAQAPKASDSALADATDVETIRSKLW